MFKHIMIPFDGTDEARAAAEQGFALAGIHKAAVTVLTVRVPIPVPLPPGGSMLEVPAPLLYEDLDVLTQDMLDKMEARGKELGLQVKTVIRSGEPAAEIVAAATEEGAELLVMAAHSRGWLESLFMGNVSDSVLHQASCPVLVYGEKTRKEAGAKAAK